MHNSFSARSSSDSRRAPRLVPGICATAVLLISVFSLSACTKRTVLSMRHGWDKIDKIAVDKIDKIGVRHVKAIEPPKEVKPSDSLERAKATDSANAVKIWLVKEKGGRLRLVPVVRNVVGTDKMRECIAELLYGPTKKEAQSGLASEIPRGTVLIGVTQHDGAVVLNLSRRFASGGDESFATRLEQLRRTIAGAAGEHKVYLDVEGKRLTEAGGEGLEVKQPIYM